MDQAALSRAARRAEARGEEGEDLARHQVVAPERRGEALRHRRRRRRLRGHPRLLPLARAQEIQGARPRVPEPLPRLPDLPGLRRRPAAARGARRPGVGPHHRSRLVAHRPRGAAASSAPWQLSEKEQAIADKVLKEIRRRLSFLERRRPRLPDARSAVVDALRRRSAAHQPGDVARLGAGRHAVRAGRAVDRPALARQPAAHRDPPPAARSGQHRARRRARRRHDQGRRSHRRSRPWRGRAGRPRGLFRHARRADAGAALADLEVPAPGARDPGADDAAARHGAEDPADRRQRAQPQGRRHQHPAEHAHRA